MGNSESTAQLSGITQLLASERISNNNIYTQLFLLPKSSMQVFENLDPASIRSMRDNHPRNLRLVLLKCLDVIKCFSKDEPLLQSVRLDDAVSDNEEALYVQDKEVSDLRKALNAINICTRIVPFILEDHTCDVLVDPHPIGSELVNLAMAMVREEVCGCCSVFLYYLCMDKHLQLHTCTYTHSHHAPLHALTPPLTLSF